MIYFEPSDKSVSELSFYRNYASADWRVDGFTSDIVG